MSATPQGVPDAPGALTASPTVDSVTYSWSAPAGNGNAVTGYEYKHYESGGTEPTNWTPAGERHTWTIDQPHQGHHLHLQRARRQLRRRTGPVATLDETPSGKPGAPQNLTATGGYRQHQAHVGCAGRRRRLVGYRNYRIEKYTTPQPPIGAS